MRRKAQSIASHDRGRGRGRSVGPLSESGREKALLRRQRSPTSRASAQQVEEEQDGDRNTQQPKQDVADATLLRGKQDGMWLRFHDSSGFDGHSSSIISEEPRAPSERHPIPL